MTKNWKYCSLYIGGERYDYILDMIKNIVYTQLFPGIPVEKLFTRCGRVIRNGDLVDAIKYKIGQTELRNTVAEKDFSGLF